MRDDLVQRLRREARVHFVHPISPLLTEAADELERKIGKMQKEIDDAGLIIARHFNKNTQLERQLAEAREALTPFAEAGKGIDPIDDDKWLMWEHPHSNKVNIGDFRRAARAFFGKGET